MIACTRIKIWPEFGVLVIHHRRWVEDPVAVAVSDDVINFASNSLRIKSWSTVDI